MPRNTFVRLVGRKCSVHFTVTFIGDPAADCGVEGKLGREEKRRRRGREPGKRGREGKHFPDCSFPSLPFQTAPVSRAPHALPLDLRGCTSLLVSFGVSHFVAFAHSRDGSLFVRNGSEETGHSGKLALPVGAGGFAGRPARSSGTTTTTATATTTTTAAAAATAAAGAAAATTTTRPAATTRTERSAVAADPPHEWHTHHWREPAVSQYKWVH